MHQTSVHVPPQPIALSANLACIRTDGNAMGSIIFVLTYLNWPLFPISNGSTSFNGDNNNEYGC